MAFMVGKAQSDDLDVRHSVNVRPDSERLLRDEKRYWRLVWSDGGATTAHWVVEWMVGWLIGFIESLPLLVGGRL